MSSWPDSFRPSTSLIPPGFQDVDARDKRGHDESEFLAVGSASAQSGEVETGSP
jgi:hypothetical protein